MIFEPFDKQEEFLLDKSRVRGLFCAKRSGKSEVAYVDLLIHGEQQISDSFVPNNGKDPYGIGLIAPTENMLRTLVWPKLRRFGASFEEDFNKSDGVFYWRGKDTVIWSASAEKIKRLEGKKLNYCLMTEVFQMSKASVIEVIARLSDSQGKLVLDGSLSYDIPNPRETWPYKMFVEKQYEGAKIWVWYTKDNPYFPEKELEIAKKNLSLKEYRALFEMDWDTPPSAAVYDDFGEANLIKGFHPDNRHETCISIDWGYAHPAAVGFYNYSTTKDIVYKFDEIVVTRKTRDQLAELIFAKINSYTCGKKQGGRDQSLKIAHWYCDIAGNQEREATGLSNIRWFKEKYDIHFKFRRSAVLEGIALVRSYIKNSLGQTRFYVDEQKCPRTVDAMRKYSYPVKDGVIQNENPVKRDDDLNDETRYFFINRLASDIKNRKTRQINL